MGTWKHMKLWVSKQNQGAKIFRFLGCIAYIIVNVCHWSWNRPRGVPLLWAHRHGEISCQKPPTGPGAHQCHFNKHVQDGEEQQNLRKRGATILTIFIFFSKLIFPFRFFQKNECIYNYSVIPLFKKSWAQETSGPTPRSSSGISKSLPLGQRVILATPA